MRERATPWRIGDAAPPAAITPLQLGAQEPVWFGFQTPPLAELRAQAWLARRGVEAWFPTETAWRRLARGPRRKVSYERPVVPRYVFARFTGAPQWPALRECRWLTRVIGTGGLPMPMSDAVMARMAEVPGRLRALRRKAEEARTVRPGDRVRIRDGAMAGWVVEVTDVHRGLARFVVPLLGAAGAAIPVDRLDKEGVDR